MIYKECTMPCIKHKCVSGSRIPLTTIMQATFAALIALSVPGMCSAQSFLVSGTSGSWPAAEAACRSARSTLALVDTRERMQTFGTDVRIAPGVPVWVDRYVGYTAIVTIEGCYSNASLTYGKITVMEDNTLVRCLTQCRSSLYIGMQGPICYCLNGVQPSVTPMLAMQCRSVCPGDTGRFSAQPVSQCGNVDARTNAVSLYRKVRPGEISLDKNLPDEGECIAYNIRSRLWQTDNCTSLRPFVCAQKPCLRPAVNCMTESPASVPWVTARMRCEGSSMTLATVNFTTDDYFFNKGAAQFPLYWTGLHRQEVTIWGNDISANEVQRSDKCVAMVKGQDGRWIWFLDWCIKDHNYVCLQNSTETTIKPTTVVPPRTTASWSTSRPTGPPTTTRRTTYSPTLNPNAQPVNVTANAPTIQASVIGFPIMLLTIMMVVL